MFSLSKFVCKSEEEADEAKGILLGQVYQIVLEPVLINHGSTDMTCIGKGNHRYANSWIVIGEKV